MQNNNNADKRQQMVNELMKKLGPDDRKRVEELLSDKDACEKILKTPEAQKLIQQFMGGK